VSRELKPLDALPRTTRTEAWKQARLGIPFFLANLLACGGGGGPASVDSSPTRVRPATVGGWFKPAGRLLQPRAGLTAVALSSDRILVMGGSATPGGAGLRTAEIYTPSKRHSALTHALNTGRTGHSIVRLASGQYLVSGGADSSTCETYDSTSGLFTLASAMASPRSGHTATVMGRLPFQVLIAGGMTAGAPATDLERSDPATGAFTPAGTLPLAPGHTATRLPSGKVLLVSRNRTGADWQPFAALYDPATGWATPTTGQPSTPREGHQALLLAIPPKVLILGGNGGQGPLRSAEWYDPATDRFTACANPMISPRQDFGAAMVSGGKVLVLGGSADGHTATRSAEQFDPATEVFAATGDLGAPRRSPVVLSLDSGEVLVLGGTNETQGCLEGVEVLSLTRQPQKPWRPLPDGHPPKPPRQPWTPLS